MGTTDTGAVTCLDYFGARYLSGVLERMLSPDNGIDQHPEDPQSWNLYAYARNNPLKYVDPTGQDFELAVTFKGDVSEEEKARILAAIRQYLVSLEIGNVVVRDTAVKSDDKRTWVQAVKDLFNKDYQTLTIDFNSTYFKDQTFLINAGDMVGRGEFADLRNSDPGQWSNIVAWRSPHEKIAHDLSIGSDMDQAGGLASYQRGTLVGGAYGRGRLGIPGLHPTDVRRLQNILVPRKRSYGP